MRRLYSQIYLTLIGVLLLFGVLTATSWWLLYGRASEPHLLDGIGALAAQALPPANDPATTARRLERIGEQLAARISLFDADGRLLGAAGDALPAPDVGRSQSGWMGTPGPGPAWAIRLPDGRWLVVKPRDRHPARPLGMVLALLLLAVAVGIGARPVVRRLTGRLERLQTQVQALGAGDLGARVQVSGRDEVARLAERFNATAERIEHLVKAQQTLLASASHELRSPLTRIRMASELFDSGTRPELHSQLARDIDRLDEMIEELLLASRLDIEPQLRRDEPVDLLAILTEEASSSGADVSGESVTLRGDPPLLRYLVRNLLQNANRYAAGSPVEARVTRDDNGRIRLGVLDRGPGVPEDERERIFQPFYRPPGHSEGDGGVGLGLYLVRRIAQLHGGEAECLQREGGGTEFRVTFVAKRT